MKSRIAAALALAATLIPLSAIADFDTTPPAQCTNLAVDSMGHHSAVLTWTNSGDDGMTGQATSFQVRYSTAPITDTNWNSAQIFCSGTPGSGGTTACCGGSGLQPNTTYYFAIKFWDEVDNESPVSNSPSGHTTNSGPEVDC